MAEWLNDDYKPCHYVAVDRLRRRLVLAIRGSLELGDVCTDLTSQPVEMQLPGKDGKEGCRYRVHLVGGWERVGVFAGVCFFVFLLLCEINHRHKII